MAEPTEKDDVTVVGSEARQNWEENGPEPEVVPDPVNPTPDDKPDGLTVEQYELAKTLGIPEILARLDALDGTGSKKAEKSKDEFGLPTDKK